MNKLILVNPVSQRSGYLLSRFSKIPPLSLAYIAAVTPKNWEVKIIDENFSTFEFENADMVGITSYTSNIYRAYEIAQHYRSYDTKVVIGGIHVSMVPDEALEYADVVVIGEAETIWPKLIADFESDNLSKKYFGKRVDYSNNSIIPRREIIDSRYFFESIQTSRGCPFNCNFCSVTRYLGREFRQRPADDVLKEICKIKGRYLFFLDDNLIGHSNKSRKRAKAIFQGMIERRVKKRWIMQTSIDAAEDEVVLKLAAKAGCMLAFIGIESICENDLIGMKKDINLKIGIDNYKKAISVFHRNGIGVIGAFIIGNDFESPDYYKDLSRFIIKTGIDAVQLAILTPLPGTKLMEKLKNEGRLIFTNFPEDWLKYRFSHVVHETKGLTAEMIYTGNNYIKKYIYSFPRKQYRLIKSFLNIKKPINFYAAYRFSRALERSWKNAHYYKNYPHSLIEL